MTKRKMPKDPLGICQYCGFTQAQHRHHIVPRSITQCDDPDNLAELCLQCHADVHAKKVDLGVCLRPEQAAKAVLLMGTLSRAYEFLYPSASTKRVVV